MGDQGRNSADWSDEALARASEVELEEYFFYLVLQLNRRRDVVLARALEPTGVSVAKWRALAVIWRLEPCTMTELAEFSVVDRTTLTRTIDQLVDEGLVERVPSPADRRLVLLTLTPAGRKATDRARAAAAASNRKILTSCTEEQTRAALSALLRTVDALTPESDEAAYGVLTFQRIRRTGS